MGFKALIIVTGVMTPPYEGRGTGAQKDAGIDLGVSKEGFPEEGAPTTCSSLPRKPNPSL